MLSGHGDRGMATGFFFLLLFLVGLRLLHSRSSIIPLRLVCLLSLYPVPSVQIRVFRSVQTEPTAPDLR